MAGIPFAKDIVTVSRVMNSDIEDMYDPAPARRSQVASNVRAVITIPSAVATLTGGDRIVFNATMTCDPIDIQPNDVVIDQGGYEWRTLTVTHPRAFGFDHMVVQLRLVTGAAAV